MSHPWLAARTAQFDSSGIRKVFDLAAKMKNPINLSIGQPDFPVPDAIKNAACEAIHADRNGYTPDAGHPRPARTAASRHLQTEYGHDDRRVLVTSGTSGACVLAMMALVDPGDEVIVFDPVLRDVPGARRDGRRQDGDHRHAIPTSSIDLDKVAAAITPRTKLILFNSPSNPTGVVASEDEVRGLAELAAKRNIALAERRDLPPLLLRRPLPSPAQSATPT